MRADHSSPGRAIGPALRRAARKWPDERQIELAHAADVEGWRAAARALLAEGCPPDAVHWQVRGEASVGLIDGLFPALPLPSPPVGDPAPVRVPAGFVTLAERALLHRDAGRHALMYRLLWRLVREPELRHDVLDPDMLAARALGQQVRRDLHKMKAFVRFTERATTLGPRFVAWFEPSHHIVAAAAPFFMRRFTTMHWAIVTPDRSVRWDGESLHFGAGARRDDVVAADAHESLWLTYYEHIFNPARLKLAAMQGEMPRRYWPNLPEARLIAPLAAAAQHRAEQMVEQTPSEPRRQRPALPAVVPAGGSSSTAAAACLACPHARHATQTVWGEGPATAQAVLVGEQPGDLEDLQGRPFVGPAGRLLDRALADVGLDRRQLYLTNAVKHFRYELRGKRRLHKTPGQRELAACAGWLEHELREVTAPSLVALGATAAQALLGQRVSVQAQRGQWHTRADGRRVLVTWHLAALLRMPEPARAEAYRVWVQDLSQLVGAANAQEQKGTTAHSRAATSFTGSTSTRE
ncbi:UdgX family uracil-DNA binding protein [Caldimonas brevitalea]|uniref:Type-4 uracil-DNA glycosylase n=1 Tax=Caldimonas brevitalea TaxID=413882 RepID=A0A0G3BNE4_9BURK|nr:UdgX family uracil-DNA binding protein [Caldimonas brevitalea]AKJ29513.1 hypothetical protein AAW51_2822 [Caldimonas brevitalea]